MRSAEIALTNGFFDNWCCNNIPKLRKGKLSKLASLSVFLPNVLRPESAPVHVVLEVVPNDVRFLKEQAHTVVIEKKRVQRTNKMLPTCLACTAVRHTASWHRTIQNAPHFKIYVTWQKKKGEPDTLLELNTLETCVIPIFWLKTPRNINMLVSNIVLSLER